MKKREKLLSCSDANLSWKSTSSDDVSKQEKEESGILVSSNSNEKAAAGRISWFES